MQSNVLRILEPAKLGDRTSKIWDLSLFGLVVLNLIAVALESVPTLQENYGVWFYNFEIFSVIIFTIEYVSRVWSAPAKRDRENGETGLKARMRYIFSFYGIIDLVAIFAFLHPSILSRIRLEGPSSVKITVNFKIESL